MEFFVGGLPFQATASDLAALVRTAVPPNAVMIVTDRDSARSEGFGAVDLRGNAATAQARDRLLLLNGTEFDGRTISPGDAPSATWKLLNSR